jgi:hypothetical protein
MQVVVVDPPLAQGLTNDLDQAFAPQRLFRIDGGSFTRQSYP